MATHKTPVTGGRTSPAPRLDKTEDRAMEAKRLEVLGKLGLQDASSLPSSAKEMLEGVLSGNRGRLELIDAEDLAKRLRDQSAQVFGEQFQPVIDRPERLPIPGNLETTKARKDGRFQVQGSLQSKDHPVNQLMRELEINPSSFGPEVRAVLDKVKGADLGHAATWNGFVRDLAIASVKGRPMASLGKEAGAMTPAHKDAPNASIGLGLEKTAKTQDAKESRLEDSPELLMNSEKIRNPEQEERRKMTVVQLQGALADAGLSKDQLEALGPLLDKVLRQGQLRGTPTEKAWAIVGNIAQIEHGKPLPKDKIKDEPKTRSATCLVAASQLMNLAEAKSGAKVDHSRTDGVAQILDSFVSGPKEEPGKKSSLEGATAKLKSAAAKLGAGKNGAAKNGPAIQAAHEHARRLGLDPENPNAKHTVKDIEAAFAKVIGDGKKTDREVALAGAAWLEKNSGGVEASLKGHIENILAAGPTNPDVAAQMKQFVLNKVGLCAAAGEEGYRDFVMRNVAASQAAGAGGAPMMAGAGGLPNLGGVFDKFGVANPMMRQAMGASILYDPALSHEDRIMLLLMLITQHMDQDRLRKMDELTELDRKEAANAKTPPPGSPTDKPTEGAEGGNPPPPAPQAPSGEPQKARDIVMFELDRIGKLRDQLFTALMEIIKKSDESMRGVLQSMQR